MLQQLGALDGHGDLRRERLGQLLVVGREDAVDLVDSLDHADELVVEADQGHGHQAARAVAGLAIDVAVEAHIGVGVGDVDGLPAGGGGAGDAPVGREADGLALVRVLVQLVAGRVVEKERRPLRLEGLLKGAEDELQQVVQVQGAGQGARDLQQGLHVLDLLLGAGEGLRRRRGWAHAGIIWLRAFRCRPFSCYTTLSS